MRVDWLFVSDSVVVDKHKEPYLDNKEELG